MLHGLDIPAIEQPHPLAIQFLYEFVPFVSGVLTSLGEIFDEFPRAQRTRQESNLEILVGEFPDMIILASTFIKSLHDLFR